MNQNQLKISALLAGNGFQMANNNMARVPITSPAYQPMGPSHVVPSVPAGPTFPSFGMPQYVVGSSPGYAMTASGIPYGINVPAGTIVPPVGPLPTTSNYHHGGYVTVKPNEVAPGMVLINGQVYQKIPTPAVPARPIETNYQHSSYDDNHSNCMTENLVDIRYDDLEVLFEKMNTGSERKSEQQNKMAVRPQYKQVRFMEPESPSKAVHVGHDRLTRSIKFHSEIAPSYTLSATKNSKHKVPKGKYQLKPKSQFYD